MINKDLLQKKIDEIAQYDLDENNVFGSAYTVTQNGETVIESYYGYTDSSKEKKVSSDTLYRICSMTKPVTTVATLIMIDRGLLSLSDPVKKYISEFENIHIIDKDGNDLGKPEHELVISDMLAHVNGFGTAVGEKMPRMTEDDLATMENTVSYFLREGLDFEPLSRQAYTAYASFDAVALIIQKLTGKNFEEFLQEEIFIPCGMKDTTYIPTENQWKRIIALHEKADGESKESQISPNCVFENIPATHMVAGAGLISSLTDYMKFSLMLLSGKAGDKTILSEKAIKLLSTGFAPEEVMPGHTQWGLGVRVITKDGHPYLPKGSFGWSGAYGSHFWVDPVNKITAIFMKNSRFDGGANNASATRFEKAVKSALEE